MKMQKHANKYDTIETWCDSDCFPRDEHCIVGRQGPEIPDLASVNCTDCLDAIMKYGGIAMGRKLDLVEDKIGQMKAGQS